ncbi:hypothetical protein TI39_contig4490g00001, partial [Zymoseptoria brevis]
EEEEEEEEEEEGGEVDRGVGGGDWDWGGLGRACGVEGGWMEESVGEEGWSGGLECLVEVGIGMRG